MATRPKALKYTGTLQNFGTGELQPDRWLPNIPARDLDEADIAALSDEQIKAATGGAHPLYVEPNGTKAAPARKRSPRASRAKPKPVAPENAEVRPAPEGPAVTDSVTSGAGEVVGDPGP